MSGAEHSSDGDSADSQVTQTGHLLAIETELGKDTLLLTALDGVETVSRGFVYTIDMLTLAPDDEVRSLLGKPVTLWLYNDFETVRRPLHGHIRHLSQLTVDIRGYRRWRAEVVPFMWFLTRSVDCRIFQDLTIPEIVRTVFDEHELTNYELRLRDQYPKLVFCVQYRETAFSFVSRLMEHAGLFYWFEHHEDRHVLVVADNNRAAKFTEPQQVVLSLRPDLGQIQDLAHDFTARTGNWALNDFDFEVPTKNLRTHEPTVLDVPLMKRFETFDYPGSYTAPEEGKKLTRLRIQEEEAHHHQVSGSGSCAGFDAGKRFTLTDRPTNGEKPSNYLLTEVRHTARDNSHFSIGAEPATYSNRFVCIPIETPFRPQRLTPKPIVQGPQTATVVGPPGESIHTDQYGRVRLLFHWDRRGKRDDHASCWIRVSQVSSGSHWGGITVPHVGQEVIVAFLEGDPDRPLVLGQVHNGTNMPPIPLPEHKNKTIMRDHGDNKIIMHGKAGRQYLSMVSPRSLNMIAVRSAAKSLSAAENFKSKNGSFNDAIDDFQDHESLMELWNIFQTLEYETADANVTATAKLLPSQVGAADSGASVDVNSMSEGNINGLSLKNTNAWVGVDLNSWVNRNVNTQVNGNATAVIGGTTYGGTSTASTNTTEVWGDNVTYAHHDNITTADHNNITNVPSGENLTNVNGENTTIVVGSN
jgi:type VI secretion system secreted protein VgrG